MNTRARISILALVAFAASAPLAAQQLTTVAVFDLERVVLDFYQDASAVRDFRSSESEYQEDLARLESTLVDYQSRRANALDRNDARTAQRLREDISALEEDILALNERWFAERQQLYSELAGNDFYARLYETIRFVAEDNGFSVVLDSNALGSALFFYSPEIDITEQVITELLRRFR